MITFFQKVAIVMVPIATGLSAVCGVKALMWWTAIAHPAFKRRFNLMGAVWALLATIWFVIAAIWMMRLP